MTYQHRNNRSSLSLESLRCTSARSRDVYRSILGRKQSSLFGDSRGARCNDRSAFFLICYRTIYNISLIRRLNSVSEQLHALYASRISLICSFARSRTHAYSHALFLFLSSFHDPLCIHLAIITIRDVQSNNINVIDTILTQ